MKRGTMKAKKEIVISLAIAFISTLGIVLIFDHKLFMEKVVYYDTRDFSFLQDEIEHSVYTEEQIADLRGVISSEGYQIMNGNRFEIATDNPFIMFEIPDITLNKVVIALREPATQNLRVEITYEGENDSSKGKHSVEEIMQIGEKECELYFPKQEVKSISIALGNEINLNFTIDKIQIMYENVKYWSFNNIVKLEFIFLGIYFICKRIFKVTIK